MSLVRIHICLVLNPGWSCFTNIPPQKATPHIGTLKWREPVLNQLGPDSCPFVGPVFETWVPWTCASFMACCDDSKDHWRFKWCFFDGLLTAGFLGENRWIVNGDSGMRIYWKAMYSAKNGQCLYVWCCVILENSCTFRFYSQAQLRTSHRHQRWQTCLFGEFQFIHVAFLSHVHAGWNDFFLGYSPHDYHILGGSVPRLYKLVLLWKAYFPICYGGEGPGFCWIILIASCCFLNLQIQ